VQFGGGFIQIRDNRVFGAYENAVEQVASNGTPDATALATMQGGTSFQFLGAVYPQGKLPCVRDFATGALIQTSACTVTLPVGSPKFERANRYNDGNFYVQDTWKVTPRLTFTPGLRWEYYGVQHSNPALDSNYYFGNGPALTPSNVAAGSVQLASNSSVGGLWKKHPYNFAPRVGLAWDPKGDGKTAVRAGYGIAYERNFGNVTYNVIQNPPNYAVLDIVAPGTPITTSAAGPLAGTGTAALPPVSLRAPIQNMPSAYSQFYNMSVEHQFFAGTLLSLEYTGSRGEHLYSIYNINQDGYGTVFLGKPAATYNGLGYPLNPQYGAINQRGANGDSYYNAFNVRMQINRFASQGLQMSANYTWSHSIDDLSSTFSESNADINLGYLDPWDPGLSRGNADFDIRQRLVVGGVYAPKYLQFSNHSKMVQTLLGGWEFAPIFTVHTGAPFSVADCSFAAYSCPDVVPAAGLKMSGNAVANGGVDSYNFLLTPAASANPYQDPLLGRSDLPTCTGGKCFQQIGIGRNSWKSPGYWNWDQGVYKDFKFRERYMFQLRGEFYNITNHKNMYVNPFTTFFAPDSYVLAIKGSPGSNGGPSPLDERRNMQLALRFQF
jgi:hypothetical protein